MYHKKEYEEYKKGDERKGAPRRRGPLPMRQPKEHIEITADTVIPPMPEKHQILPKPNWEANYEAEYRKIQEELDKLKAERVYPL
jgi:hypothetical protein